LLVSGFRPAERDQVAQRRAEPHLPVARLLDIAGQGDDARDHRLAMGESTIGRVDRRDVEALHAEFGRALAGRHFLAGQDADQLLGAAGRVAGRNGNDLIILGQLQHCRLHGRDGFRLVVLDADEHSPGASRSRKMAMPRTISSARSRISRSSQVMKGSHSAPLMTSCSTATVFAAGQLGVAGKHRATEADDAGIAQQFAHALGRQSSGDRPACGHPLVTAVGLNDHAQRWQSGRMRGDMVSMASTVPEVGACTAADSQPSALPINCPLSTCSPGCTSGFGEPPML
jgi:hypothetical protein